MKRRSRRTRLADSRNSKRNNIFGTFTVGSSTGIEGEKAFEPETKASIKAISEFARERCAWPLGADPTMIEEQVL